MERVRFLVLLFCTACDGCLTPLSISHDSLLVEYGDPVELSCSIPTKPSQYLLGWETSINPIDPTDSETSLVWRSPSLTDWEVNRNRILCYLSEPNQPQCEKRVNLSLYKRPDSVKISSESDVWSEDQKMTLKCEVQNVGPLLNLTVRWIRTDQNKNKPVSETSYGSFSSSGKQDESGNVTATLEITASRDEDGVQYQCVALLNLDQLQHPQVGQSELHTISVHYKPTIVQRYTDTISVTRGDSLTLNCSAHGNPSPQYAWSSPGNQILTRSSIFTIDSIQPEDQGQYSCTASNTEGSDSVTVRVTVVDKPTIVQRYTDTISVTRGDSLTLNCSAHGNPSPQYVWRSPGNQILTNSSIFTIDSVQSEDQGQYSCTASNTEGSDSVTVRVTVVDKPTIVQRYTDTISVTRGDSLTLNCSAHGNPSPQYVWSSPGNQILTRSSIFTIDSVQSEDQGQYSCTASNTEGSDSVTVRVTVVDKPTIVQRYTDTISVTRGDSVTLNCSAHGNPSPQYVWRSPGNQILTNSSIFTINSVQSEDQGQYSCTASNTEGSDSVTVRVTVVENYLPIIIICAAVAAGLLAMLCICVYKRYRHTYMGRYILKSLTSRRHNANAAHNDMDQSEL